MELVAGLQRQDVGQFAHVAAAGGGGARESLNRGRVLEVKGNGSYGYIRPEELGGDLEVYFRMEDCETHVSCAVGRCRRFLREGSAPDTPLRLGLLRSCM